MKTEYIGRNQYRYRYFKSPLGFTKFLLDVFVHPNFINISETNINGDPTEDDIRRFAQSEVARIEALA